MAKKPICLLSDSPPCPHRLLLLVPGNKAAISFARFWVFTVDGGIIDPRRDSRARDSLLGVGPIAKFGGKRSNTRKYTKAHQNIQKMC